LGVTLSRDEGEARLELKGSVDIFEARELHRLFVEALGAPRGVVVDMKETLRIDTAGSQLLLALKRALASRGKSLVIEAPPEGVREAWRLLGLSRELESP
jgi:anti-anti-sigma factor